MPRESFLVTGGAGFVGSNLVAALLERRPDAEVVVIDDFRTGSTALIGEALSRRGLGPFRGEIVASGVEEVNFHAQLDARRPRAVFHLGAITDTTLTDERLMLRINTEPFGPMARACAEFDIPLVYASSAATYGSPPQGRARTPFPVEAAGRPDNIYGLSKWLMEAEHARVSAEHRERTGREPWIVGLRYFNVYGPGERLKGKMASMAWQLGARLLSGERPRLFVDGSQARDQVHVDDVVECTLAAAGLGDRPDPAPGVYNAGSGVPTSFNEMLSILRRALEVPESVLPTEYFQMPASVREFYQEWTCADMSATARGLGFVPRIPPADGLRRYAEFMRHARAKRGRA